MLDVCRNEAQSSRMQMVQEIRPRNDGEGHKMAMSML